MSCHSPDDFKDSAALIDLKCPINQGVLNDPIRDECGHVFCKGCFQEAYKQDKICPVTKQKIGGSTQPADDLRARVAALNVFCKHKNEGCPWSGPNSALPEHLKTQCPQESSKCTIDKCEQSVKRFELPAHQEKCEWRVKKCQFCDKTGNDIEMEEHHNSDCQEIPIDCEKRCIVKHKRKHKDLHDKFNCEKTKHDCYFRNAGCYFTGNWDEMGRHSSEAFIIHATMLEQKLQHFEAYKAVATKMVNEISANKEKYPELEHFVKDLDDTEDIDFKSFKGGFDKTYSNKKLVVAEEEDDRVATSKSGNKDQLLWLNRLFHEHHRIVLTIEKYRPEGDRSAFSIGLAQKGVLLENGATEYLEADKKKYRLFSDSQPNGLSDLKIPIKEGNDYMLSYEPDKCLLVFEHLSLTDEDPATVQVEFSTEFWEWQPVIVLSGDVVLRLMDFNDWNQQ
jgi:hypothetical protein